MSLIAHLDCAPLAEILPQEGLPTVGTLAFFYDAVNQEAWGDEPWNRDYFRVLYLAESGTAPARDFPSDVPAHGRFASVVLAPQLQWVAAPVEGLEVERSGVDRDRYRQAVGDSELLSAHRFLGHPDLTQGEMQTTCQANAPGVPGAPGDPADWRLLLQIDGDEAAGMEWGDVGRLYWWIRAEDLRAHQWQRSWCVLQSH